jgi:hypothetical protein
MVARTTDEILRELDRTQGGPVRFEDTRTHARYVVIPEDAYLQSLPLLGVGQDARPFEPLEWNDAKNARRIDLIQRKYSRGITEEEASELNVLQDEMYRYRAQVAPLPLEMLELLKEGLERRAEQQNRDAAP